MACDSIKQEIAISKLLSGHPYIVDFIAAAAISKAQSKENRNEFLLLSELCTGVCVCVCVCMCVCVCVCIYLVVIYRVSVLIFVDVV